MIGRALFVAIAGCALIQGSAAAQMPGFPGRIAVEVRGGMSVGNHSESAAKLDVVPKPSFDAVLKVEVIPTVSVFGGFYRTTFGCEEGFCTDRDITIVGNHGAFGAQWVPDLGVALGPWLRAGLLVGTTRAGTLGADPETGFGYDIAAGLRLGFGRVSALPGVSYRYMQANKPASTAYAVALSGHLGIAIELWGG